MTTDENNAAPDPQPAELAGQQEVSLPPFPRTYYDAFGDGSEPLYTGKQMQDYARAALAATGKQQDGCTESNCRRCLTHPDHRGDMPHAGIGSTGKQQVGEVQGDALIDAALGYLSTALDDLDSCPDRRPGIMVTEAMHALREAISARQPVRIYGCCAQPEGELHTAECPNMRHLVARQPGAQVPVDAKGGDK